MLCIEKYNVSEKCITYQIVPIILKFDIAHKPCIKQMVNQLQLPVYTYTVEP